MIALIQRVSHASVTIAENLKSEIQKGMLILVGVGENDEEKDVIYLTKKIINLRIFADEQGKMNLSIQDTKGDILVISQFTLYADTQKGNRPSFIKSAKPEKAIILYDFFIKNLENILQKEILTGEFGADMQVTLCNDGPITIILESENA
jgi:D-aminoacyl-tRNA deacylase